MFRFQGMIADWRERKGMGDFAFMTVQLPPSVPFFPGIALDEYKV